MGKSVNEKIESFEFRREFEEIFEVSEFMRYCDCDGTQTDDDNKEALQKKIINLIKKHFK